METVLAHQYNARVLSKRLMSMLARPTRTYIQSSCMGCSHQKDAHLRAQPVSPLVEITENAFSCYVDCNSQLFEIHWSNTENCPSLSHFPSIDSTVHKVGLSPQVEKTLSDSVFLSYGVDGIIRCAHRGEFPILKIAHPTQLARRRIQYEFKMLEEMRRQSLPVPFFNHEPLTDDEGIYGYCMERLWPIDYSKLHAVSTDVRAIVERVHSSGFAHGDLNPSNIMRNKEGSLVLIDTSFSGRLRTSIPDHLDSYQYRTATFDTDTDRRYLDMFFS